MRITNAFEKNLLYVKLVSIRVVTVNGNTKYQTAFNINLELISIQLL